ncbi:MAG: DUF2889 domain-containing protein [Peptococcaceae bacterium]|nr:DUF2889 domain-containing protein [Peptococcaceae bacterium]
MLGFSRTKWVGIERPEEDVYLAHGILEDLIYGMEIDVRVKAPEFEIIAVEGKMRRITTPECPKALPVLQNAVGLRLDAPGLAAAVNRKVGREGCRHLANLILECCDAIVRCALYEKWPGGPDVEGREEYLKGRLRDLPFMKGSCKFFGS